MSWTRSAKFDVFIYSCQRQEGLDKAIKLSEDLLGTVKAEWERFQQNPPPYARNYGRGSYGHGYGHQPPPPPGVCSYFDYFNRLSESVSNNNRIEFFRAMDINNMGIMEHLQRRP